MKVNDPWELLNIRLVDNSSSLHYFDNDVHLVYVLIGDVTISFEDKFMSLKKDDFLVLSRTVQYNLLPQSTDTKIFELSLKASLFNDIQKNDYDTVFIGNSVTDISPSDGEIIAVINKLIELYVYKEKASDSLILKNYFSLLHLFEENYSYKIQTDESKTTQKKIEELKNYIDNNFDLDINFSEIAEKMYVSPHYLSRLFTKQNGLSLSEYLMNKRMEKVRKELLETDYSITDIAFSAGFSNINSFNRIFKKHLQMTPSEYRKSVKEYQASFTLSQIQDENLDYLHTYFENKNEDIIEDSIQFGNTVKEELCLDDLLINLGYAEDLLNYSYMKQLNEIGSKNIFKYGRIWGLLSNKVLKKTPTGYDFSEVDMILSNIIDCGFTPFLEIGFKGKNVYKTHGEPIVHIPYLHYSNDFNQILERYEMFLRHCIQKFGIHEVSQWVIEIWKPNKLVLETNKSLDLVKLVDAEKLVDISKSSGYLYFFQKIYDISKSVVPKIKVGGCGLGLDLEKKNIHRFLTEWKNSTNYPDFFSITLYHMDEISSSLYTGKRANPISPDVNYMINNVNELKQIMNDINWDPPLYITEFNVTIIDRHIINETAFKGPYIAKNILDVRKICKTVGYWHLSDFSAIAHDTNDLELFGGAGILSKEGIPKSGFYAFDFLKRLGKDVIFSDKDCIFTRKIDGELQGLFYFYNHLNATYYYNSEGSFHKKNAYSIFNSQKKKSGNVRIQNMEEGEYVIHQYRIGKKEGNLLEESIKIMDDECFNQEEINYLRNRSIPTLSKQVVKVSNDELTFRFELESYDLLFIRINKI